MINYDHALGQVQAAGLLLDRDSHGKPPLFDGRIQRWRVAGEDREWRGWTRLNQWVSAKGVAYLVGVYGVWHGNDPGQQKIELPPPDPALSKEQLAAHRDEARAIAEAARVAARQMEEARKVEARTAARWSAAVWAQARPCQEYEYLTRKGVKSHGLRQLESLEGLRLDGIDEGNWWRLTQACPEGHPALVVPMHDVKGQVCGIQFIYGRGHPRKQKTERDKEFWPAGMAMGGTFGVIGPLYRDGILALGEGYATMASVHEAAGLTAVYAFSANNLAKAAKDLRKAFAKARILITADDDYLTEGNPGTTAAAQVTAQVADSAWIKPDFTGPDGDLRAGKKLSDFNDLAILAGNPLPLATQINDALDRLGWRGSPAQARGPQTPGGGEGGNREGVRLAMMTPDEAVRRFSPVWSHDDVYYFDHLERVVVSRQSIANRMPRNGWDQITSHPEWREKPEVPIQRVDFDPTESDPEVTYNLWGGWRPISTGAATSCTAILALLRHLCSHEIGKADEVYWWVLCFLAYPLQHPGAKMQSCILIHGGQGAGKNTVFDTLLEVYGTEYSVQFGPKQLEKRFNALFSKKLFAIGNEVVASREDLYHVKGNIKHMITEGRWVVEAKNKDERWERNCCNFVFLSNEINPQALDKGDRRHAVIWTPDVPDPQRDPDEYARWRELWEPAHAERKNGGAAALYDYLMDLDLGDFYEATWPPMTQAKQDLIDLNLDSRERFWASWTSESIDGLPSVPCASEDLFEAYRAWVGRVGIGRHVALHSLMAYIGKQRGARKAQERIQDGFSASKRTVVYPPGFTDPPPGKTRSTWLGETVAEFREALDQYRGGKP